MNRCILFFVFLVIPFFSSAQSDDDMEQQQMFTLLILNDLQQAKKIIDSRFLNSKDKSRQVIGYIHLSYYYQLVDEHDNNNYIIKALDDAKKIAIETGKEIDWGYVEFGYATYYMFIKRWDLFAQSMQKSMNVFQKYPHENYMLAILYQDKITSLKQNTHEKEDLDNYILGTKYALKSKNQAMINISYNNLGLFYSMQFERTREKKYNDFAESAFHKSREAAIQDKDQNVGKKLLSTYYSNIGLVYLNNKEYSRALAIYNEAFQLYKNDKDKISLSYIFGNMGNTYLLMENYSAALDCYLKAEPLAIKGMYNVTQFKIELYQNISKAYEKLQKYDKALIYEQKLREEIVEDDKLQYSHNTSSLETFYKTEQEKNVLSEKNRSFQKLQLWYIIAITCSVLIAILLFFTLYYRQKLNKRTTSLLKSEKEKLEMEHELAIMKQEQLQKQALATSIQLEHKNIFINELKGEVQNNKNVQNLIKEEQHLDNNFNTIRNIIQETHPNFFKRLNELSGNSLTNTDLKYAAYIYLNMDNSQIAAALKVDPKTVSVTKHRLKQKLKIDKNQDLNQFIRNLEL